MPHARSREDSLRHRHAVRWGTPCLLDRYGCLSTFMYYDIPGTSKHNILRSKYDKCGLIAKFCLDADWSSAFGSASNVALHLLAVSWDVSRSPSLSEIHEAAAVVDSALALPMGHPVFFETPRDFPSSCDFQASDREKLCDRCRCTHIHAP